nr:glutamine synthetase [Xanthomonas oryzae]
MDAVWGFFRGDYLLANDMEMVPVPGYASASWSAGYGDFILRPDFSSLRLLPWLDATALLICDVYSENGQPVAQSPREGLNNPSNL